MAPQKKVTMAFTASQIATLAGISVDRLRYWERTKAFEPERAKRIVSGPYSRIYSFQDLVNIRVMARLRIEHNIDLAQLRRISRYLGKYQDSPWSSLAVRVNGKKLEFRDPATAKWISADPFGQSLLAIEFAEVSSSAEYDARKSMRRNPELHGKLSRHRNVMSNELVFAGTRIPVAAVVRLLNHNYSVDEVLRSYPTLTEKDVLIARKHEHASSHAA